MTEDLGLTANHIYALVFWVWLNFSLMNSVKNGGIANKLMLQASADTTLGQASFKPLSKTQREPVWRFQWTIEKVVSYTYQCIPF